MGTIGKESISTALLAAVVTLLASGVLLSGIGAGGNLAMATLSFSAGGVGVAYLNWVVLMFVGNWLNRDRSMIWKVATNILTAILVAVGNTLVYTLLAADPGPWAALAAAIITLASGVFAISAIAAVLLTHLVLFRHRSVP